MGRLVEQLLLLLADVKHFGPKRQRVVELDERESSVFVGSVAAGWHCCLGCDDCCKARIYKKRSQKLRQLTHFNSHLSNEDKMFVGTGRKLRIDVGGKVVDVNIGRLVERVWVDVVGCVFELTRACVASAVGAPFSVDPAVLVVGV